nr:GlxA family transcriptional regulator [Sphingomonas sp. Y57]
MAGKAVANRPEIGLVVYPGCQLAMIHGMTDLLEIAGRLASNHGREPIRVSHWQLQDAGGFARCHDTHPGEPGSPAYLLVPGSLSGVMDAREAAPYARFLLDRHAQGATLGSNCGGAFVLAATGLLSGRPATTHWMFANAFRERFPDVLLDPDKIVIEDGDIITAGGLMAWTDLGLKLVDRLFGPTVVVETGRFLLVDPAGREQRHYSSFSPRMTHGDEPILKVQHWLQAKGARAVSVVDMAARAGMEERTFLRRFKAATGLKPTEYSQHLRMGRARELLEYTRRPVEQIAWTVGYEDAAAFRKLFHRIIGLSPGDYRQRFGIGRGEVAAA